MLDIPDFNLPQLVSMSMTTSSSPSNSALDRWNSIDAESAAREVLPCCGSSAWAEALAALRPFASAPELLAVSDRVWAGLAEDDWQEAFDSHPRIGQQHAHAATAESLALSSQEQGAAMSAEETVKLALAEGNRQYEERFGRIFIVCAADKSAAEILAILNGRMIHNAATELLEAAEQQRQITQLRLRRWLGAG
jgi:2-oxo-4-hydroxy-4-carboxy-5-ureidoimidazoline decarboxylase